MNSLHATQPTPSLRPTRSRRRSVPFGITVGALLLLSAWVQAQPLLLNGDFEQLDEQFNPVGWELAGDPGNEGVAPVVRPGSGHGDRVLRLGDMDPTGSDWAAPVVLARQAVALPPMPPPVRVIVSGRVARDPLTPGLPDAIQIGIAGQTGLPGGTGGDQLLPLAVWPPVVAADGEFHDFIAAATLPPMPPEFELRIIKTGPGQFWLDGLVLEPEPGDLQVDPPVGPSEGNIEVQVIGPLIQPGVQILFGDAPANILELQPGQAVVQPPPHSPGPADVQIVDPGGLTEQRTGAFVYLAPLRIATFVLRVGAPGGDPNLEINGSGFMSVPIEVHAIELDTGDFHILPIQTIFSGQRMTVELPPLPESLYSLQLQDSTGRTTSSPPSSPLRIVEPPRIEAVTPDHGPASGGTAVTIHGNGFEPDANVFFGDVPAASSEVIGPDTITAVTPPNLPLQLPVTVRNPGGLPGTLPNAFQFEQRLPGDVNGDQIIDLNDVMLSLGAAVNEPASAPLLIEADADGNERIGLAEAIKALEASEVSDPTVFEALPKPTLTVLTPSVTNGTPAIVLATRVADFGEVRIEWGDDFADVINADGEYAHTYDGPGSYGVAIVSDAGPSAAQTVTVLPESLLRIEAIELRLSGFDIHNQPITGRVAQITADQPPTVEVVATAEGPGVVEGQVLVVAPQATDDVAVPVRIEFGGDVVETRTAMLGNLIFPTPGEYFITFEPNEGIQADVEAAHPMPLTVQVPAFVTEQDCREIERRWRELIVAKEAKKKDCEELEKQLQDLKDQRTQKQADRDAAQNQRDALQGDLDDAQNEFDDLFDQLNRFLGGAGQLVQYSGKDDFPPGSQYAGARHRGASAGIGVAFGSAGAILERFDLYKSATGHSIGQDMNRLRDLISQTDDLRQQIADKDAELQKLDQEIQDLDQKIADKQAELDACRRECDQLEQQIKNWADAHKECLEQLEKQRRAAGAIRDADGHGATAQGEADRTAGAADGADDFIDGRAGSPGQTGADHGAVQAGRDCQQQAQDLINQGKQKLQQARSALQQGDTATAEQLANEAKQLFDQANAMLDDCRRKIADGRSSAAHRKPRQCDDGTVEQGRTITRNVWTEVFDVALAPQGRTPEQWMTSKKNAEGVLDGISKLLKLIGLLSDAAEKVGVDFPLGGTVTPDADKVARGIVNAHLELFEQRFPFCVWVKVRGHTAWSRVDRICVNGCWEIERHEGVNNDVVEDQIKIGTIWGGDRASREKQLRDILDRFYSQHHVTR